MQLLANNMSTKGDLVDGASILILLRGGVASQGVHSNSFGGPGFASQGGYSNSFEGGGFASQGGHSNSFEGGGFASQGSQSDSFVGGGNGHSNSFVGDGIVSQDGHSDSCKKSSMASSHDRCSKKAFHVTESIGGKSVNCHLGSGSNRRVPFRDRSNGSLMKTAGTLSIEAVSNLQMQSAIKQMSMSYCKTLGEYPLVYIGLRKCHLRALYSVSPQAAKLALFKGIRYNQVSEIQDCLQQFKGPKKGKVFQLRQTHWVSICPSFYTDDSRCWRVTNIKKACEVLTFLSLSTYSTNALP
jgi:hypothetical protein